MTISSINEDQLSSSQLSNKNDFIGEAITTFSSIQLRRVGRTSWVILMFSLLIDTSHERSFPSYNVTIGFFACYIGHLQLSSILTASISSRSNTSKSSISKEKIGGADENSRMSSVSKRLFSPNDSEKQLLQKEERQDEVREASVATLVKTLTCFCFVALFSLAMDITYCSAWGQEILDGDRKSVKFSFALFILNIFAKGVAVFYAAAIIFEETDEMSNRNIAARRSSIGNTASIKEEETPDVLDEEEEEGSFQQRPSIVVRNSDKTSPSKLHSPSTLNSTLPSRDTTARKSSSIRNVGSLLEQKLDFASRGGGGNSSLKKMRTNDEESMGEDATSDVSSLPPSPYPGQLRNGEWKSPYAMKRTSMKNDPLPPTPPSL